MRVVAAVLLVCAATAAYGQVSPTPGPDDPRLQTLVQPAGEPARLVVFPQGSLTLIMRRDERVERVVLSDSSAFHVAVTGDNDSLSITPQHAGALATMTVQTNRGQQQYDLETGRGLAAAYVVRLVGASEQAAQESFLQDLRPDLAAMTGHYRLKGDGALRPEKIADNGYKTYIEWGAGQPLPAVLGVGAGGEEVVPGHMRNGIFTIDRVYSELVFRIDRQKTVAVRETDEGRQ